MSDKKEKLEKAMEVADTAAKVAGSLTGAAGSAGMSDYVGTPGFNPNASGGFSGSGSSGIGNMSDILTNGGFAGTGISSGTSGGADRSALVNDGCFGGTGTSAGAGGIAGGESSGGMAGGTAGDASSGGGASSGTPPGANEAWFTVNIEGGSGFSVYAFSGYEEVSSPYEFQIELVHASAAVDINGLVGKDICLSVADRSGGKRLVHGSIREFTQLHTANARTHYTCLLVPRLWYLGQTRDNRIFQQKSVVDIIAQILQEQGFSGDHFSFKCHYQYKPREYCLQYGESDLHFISRLCEEEGIFFYHEHSDDKHTLCFCDMPDGPPIAGDPNVRFYAGSGTVADAAVMSRFYYTSSSHSNKSTYRDWNFTTPNVRLEAKLDDTDAKKYPVPGGVDFDTYRYPYLYQEKDEGERYVDLQLQRQGTMNTWAYGESDISRFVPSYVFQLAQHPRQDLNAGWWLVSVRHEGEQPGVLEQEAPDRGLYYKSSITAIPKDIRFVPENLHRKNKIIGQQTAIVTGPEGEEIYPDKYGRVKVQFFWDREGEYNEKTTCWMRVSQGWAGSQYGTMAIPRIGHEVIVSFLGGDPDRPLITGRVYHAGNMPPYTLPDHKTRTVFKSMSTPGEEGSPRGFNELRIEDKKGSEEIYIHAEKDVNTYVKNDWKNHILHDRHDSIDNFTYIETKGETHEILHDQRKTELHANDNLTVHAERHEKIDEKWLVKVGDEIHIKAGAKIVIEAGAELTLKGGGTFIKLDPSGMKAVGAKINLNSGGSAGTGSGASPELPIEALIVGEAPKPKRENEHPDNEELVSMNENIEDCMSEASEDGSAFVTT